MSAYLERRAVAAALRGDVAGPRTILVPGPGHSPADRSLSVTIDPSAPEGFRVHSFCGDHWTTCRDYVRASIGLPAWTPTREMRRVANPAFRKALVNPTNVERTASAGALWRQAGAVHGTLGERYLNGRRLELDPDLAEVLRFHPRCPFGKGETVPALLAPFHAFDVSRDEAPTAILRIGLRSTGEKISKKMLGPVRGCAVKLDADEDVTLGLHIGEGLETCLAARVRHHWRPIWCCASAGGIRDFPPLSGVECLTIAADHDHAGLSAAQACAERWQAAGKEVFVRWPDGLGRDFADGDAA